MTNDELNDLADRIIAYGSDLASDLPGYGHSIQELGERLKDHCKDVRA